MAEYIEREAAIKAIDNEVSLDGLYANIKAIPAADVQAVRHGKWDYLYDNPPNIYAKCSNCGQTRNAETQTGWSYCPNCGAKMDGEDGDGNGS